MYIVEWQIFFEKTSSAVECWEKWRPWKWQWQWQFLCVVSTLYEFGLFLNSVHFNATIVINCRVCIQIDSSQKNGSLLIKYRRQ